MPQTLKIAVCLANDMTFSDFITPFEILGCFNMADDPVFAQSIGEVPYRVQVDYLAPTLQPITAMTPGMPTINPTRTYHDASQINVKYDIIWVPAGPVPDMVKGKDITPEEEISFLKNQAPRAKYVLSVCGGALSLATAGILEGKRATTNKAFFRVIEGIASKNITWVPKARWVVDGNIWTSSGVTAGSDMALAFVEHLAGPKIARVFRGLVEIPEIKQEDDPFAEFHGLL